jgi:hypothetical protein
MLLEMGDAQRIAAKGTIGYIAARLQKAISEMNSGTYPADPLRGCHEHGKYEKEKKEPGIYSFGNQTVRNGFF